MCTKCTLFMVVMGFITGWCDLTSSINWEQARNFMHGGGGFVTGWCDITSPVNWEQMGNFMLWYYSVLVVSCLAPLHAYHYSTERLPCISCTMGNTGRIGTCRMLEFGALTEYWGDLTKVLYISYLIIFKCIHHIDFSLEHDLFLRSSLVFPVNNWMTDDEYTI
jgi:hypothetical protein